SLVGSVAVGAAGAERTISHTADGHRVFAGRPGWRLDRLARIDLEHLAVAIHAMRDIVPNLVQAAVAPREGGG
ncbi:hypothetical protein CN334_30470, partial [Bacillus thuringiensis]